MLYRLLWPIWQFKSISWLQDSLSSLETIASTLNRNNACPQLWLLCRRQQMDREWKCGSIAQYAPGSGWIIVSTLKRFPTISSLLIPFYSWLRRVYYSMPKEDSVVAMGGIPLGLKQAILRDLENFRKLNCELFIVFNGIPQPMRKSLPLDTRPDVRKQVRIIKVVERCFIDPRRLTGMGKIPARRF